MIENYLVLSIFEVVTEVNNKLTSYLNSSFLAIVVVYEFKTVFIIEFIFVGEIQNSKFF